MIAAGLSALLSHWRRHKLQLFTLVAGLALATALWSGVQAINTEARASYAEAADTLGEGTLSRLRPIEGATIPEEAWVSLRRAVPDDKVEPGHHPRRVEEDRRPQVQPTRLPR